MSELVEKIGKIVVGAIIKAIQEGKSRREAMDAGAAAVRREEIVSDDLWAELERYIETTKDFEENGAG